jgi:hypothetical protein
MYVKVYKGIPNGKTTGSWQANTKKKGGNLESKAGNHQTSHDLNTGMQTIPLGSRTDLCKPNKRTTNEKEGINV